MGFGTRFGNNVDYLVNRTGYGSMEANDHFGASKASGGLALFCFLGGFLMTVCGANKQPQPQRVSRNEHQASGGNAKLAKVNEKDCDVRIAEMKNSMPRTNLGSSGFNPM